MGDAGTELEIGDHSCLQSPLIYGEWRMPSALAGFIFAGSRAGRAAPHPPAGRTEKRSPPGGRALASCPRNCARRASVRRGHQHIDDTPSRTVHGVLRVLGTPDKECYIQLWVPAPSKVVAAESQSTIGRRLPIEDRIDVPSRPPTDQTGQTLRRQPPPHEQSPGCLPPLHPPAYETAAAERDLAEAHGISLHHNVSRNHHPSLEATEGLVGIRERRKFLAAGEPGSVDLVLALWLTLHRRNYHMQHRTAELGWGCRRSDTRGALTGQATVCRWSGGGGYVQRRYSSRERSVRVRGVIREQDHAYRGSVLAHS